MYIALIAIIAGLLTALSLSHQIWFLAIVGVTLFLWVLQKRNVTNRLVLSFIFAYSIFLLHIRWISVLGIDVWFALSLLCALPWLVFAIPMPRRGLGAVMVPTATVVIVELLRSTVPWGGFPWGLLAYSQVSGPIVRLSTLGGSSLVSGAVVAIAASILLAIQTKSLRWLSLPILAVLISHLAPVIEPNGSLQVALVQGSVPRLGYATAQQATQVAKNHISATDDFLDQVDSGKASKPDVIIWPESGTDIDPIPPGWVHQNLDALTKRANTPILVGATFWNPTSQQPMNVGIMWRANTGPSQIYAKNHLVPFGEYIPMRNIVSRFVKRLDQISSDYLPGVEPGNFKVAGHTLGDVICFEVAYGDHIRRTISGGAEIIAVQTNNATYLHTDQPEQQFAITRFRAIEHQRAFVVASTSGISGVIESDGSVFQQTKEAEQITVSASVNTYSAKTFTDKAPYWFVVLSLFAFLAHALRLRRKSEN